MSEQYENNKCLVHLIFWSHPWSLHPLTYKHNYITFNDHITIHNTHKTKHTVEYKLQQLQLKSICFLWMSSVSYFIWSDRTGGCYWTEHVVKLPCSDSSTLFTRRHGDGDTLARSSSAGQLDTYITPSPHHPWPAGGWGWCEAAWRQAGLLTTHYTALHCTGHTDTGHGGFGEMRSGH